MSKSTKIVFFGTAVVLLVGSCVAAFAQAPNRLVKAIDEDEVVTLTGNVHPMARPEFDQGVVSAGLRLEKMILHLEPSASQQAELEALVEAQHNPASPLYHQWLTPAQYGARFGASGGDLAQITAWLTAHGFTIDEIAASNRQILFSGTAAQVADAFHTEIHRYLVNGVSHIANAQDPQIPAALAGVVGGVVSLHDFRRNSAIRTRMLEATPAGAGAAPQYSSGSVHYLYPADWATIYDLNSLYAAGTNGTGTSIAIVGRSNINLTDVANFRAAAALTANAPSVILANGNPGLVSGDQDESTLDVEWSGAIAPKATVKFVVAESTNTTDGIDLSAQYIVNNKTAPVMSTSYGSCEADMGSVELSFYNKLWQQAAAEGISSFVSSGDSGVAGCFSSTATSASSSGVNGLCSSTYSTCVGGTEFNEGSNTAQYWSTTNSVGNGSAKSYIPEKVWNESASDGGSGLLASGGGVSFVYSQPTWQAGVAGTSAANSMRAVPDVAMAAAGHDGYFVIENNQDYIFSGTSAASPTFAALMALLVESKGGTGVGNANTGLYPLVNAIKNPFHPTPTGNNSVPGVTGYSATGTTYNLATGLGSVDGALLVSAWGSGSSTPISTDFVLSATASSGTVLTGKSTSFAVSVVESGTAKNAVTLTASTLAGVTVTILPASITPGSTGATVTLNVAATAAAASGTLTITGTDSTGTQKLSYVLTITQPPTLAMSAAATSLTLNQASAGTVGLTVTTGGSYTGNLTFSTTGLPSGVTAGWTTNPITTASGVKTTSQTLTLTASATATTGTSTVVITVAGDGLTATQNVALKVQALPTLTVAPVSTALSVIQGAAVTDTINLTANSTFTGTVALAITGLPNGVSASWKSTPVTLTNLAGSATVTLTSTSAAPIATSNISIVATGDGLTVTKAMTLQVLPAPTLSMTVASTALSVTQSKSVTDGITLAVNSSFSGTVTLSVTGLPASIASSWSSSAGTASNAAATTTLTLTPSTTTAAGTYSGTITATGDGLTVSKAITVQVLLLPTLTVTPASTALSVTQGASVTDAITLAGNSTYTGAVTLSVTGLPSTIAASWKSSPVTLANEAGSSTLTLTPSTTTAAGTYSGTITATGDGLTVTKAITVQVLALPTLSVTPASAALSVTQGASVTDSVTLAGNSTYAGAVTLSVTGLPSSIAASWKSSPVTLANEAGTSTLTLTPSTTTAAGTYSGSITATGDGLTVSKAITVQVLALPTLTATPASTALSVTQGASVTDVVTLAGNSTYTGAVTLSVTGLPTTITASWKSSPVTLANEAGSSTLTLAASAGAAVGSYSGVLTATGDGLTVSKAITVQVSAAPALQMTASAASLTMSHSSTGSVALSVTPLGGLSSAVSLSVSGLPAGITTSFSSSTIAAPGSGSAKLTFTGSSAAKAGTTTVTVTAATASTAANAAHTVTQTVSLILQ
jgi:uncharacterized membrane protein